MSMLTEQCARLRSWAKQFDERADVDALAPLLASDLREAADTILRLREMAQASRETCDWVLEHSGTLYDKWRCSKCGYLFVEPRCDQGYTDMEPNFCPNCGAKVVD